MEYGEKIGGEPPNILSVAGISPRLAGEISDVEELRELGRKLIQEQMKVHHTDVGGDKKRNEGLSRALTDIDDGPAILKGIRDEYLRDNPFGQQLSEAYASAERMVRDVKEFSTRVGKILLSTVQSPYPWPLETPPCRIRLFYSFPFLERRETTGKKRGAKEWYLRERKLNEQAQKMGKFPDRKTREAWENKIISAREINAENMGLIGRPMPYTPRTHVRSLFAAKYPDLYEQWWTTVGAIDDPELFNSMLEEHKRSPRYRNFMREVRRQAVEDYSRLVLNSDSVQERLKKTIESGRKPVVEETAQDEDEFHRAAINSEQFLDLLPDGSVIIRNDLRVKKGTQIIPIGDVRRGNSPDSQGAVPQLEVGELCSIFFADEESSNIDMFTIEPRIQISSIWGTKLVAIVKPPYGEPFVGFLGDMVEIQELPEARKVKLRASGKQKDSPGKVSNKKKKR